MLLTILIGVHVLVVALARTAVQAAADRAVAAAQAAPLDLDDCDGDGLDETLAECEGVLAAQIALAGASGSVVETRLPAVIVEVERGTVTALVHGGTISPVLGGLEMTAVACGPLDNVRPSDLTGMDVWRC